MKLKQNLLVIVLLFLTICCFAQDLTEEELDKNYKDEMNVILHYTSGFRFGTNLNVGDYVKYEVKENMGYEMFITLEVSEKNEEGIWIIEKFDGNEVHMLFDPEEKKLLRIWGYDERKDYQEFGPIQEQVIEEKLPGIIQKVIKGTFSDTIELERDNKTISTKAGSFNCISYNQSYNFGEPTEPIPKTALKKIQEETQLYFSEEIPKLYPLVHLATHLIGKEEVLKNSNAGFVKNNVIELVEFRKGEK